MTKSGLSHARGYTTTKVRDAHAPARAPDSSHASLYAYTHLYTYTHMRAWRASVPLAARAAAARVNGRMRI